MSNTDKNSSEEVDLGVLFKAISNMFKALFSSLASSFLKIYRLFIYACKIIINNYKIILPIIIVSFLLGVFKESKSNPLYSSKMLVKTFFDSKYQLIDNLDYYNSLIINENLKELKMVFDIDDDDLKSLVSFSISPGLESRNDLLKHYDKYVKEIDTSMTSLISFEEFIKNRELFSGNLFEISVVSNKTDVFKKLEKGLNTSFENDYSLQVKKKRDSVILITKKSIKEQVKQINVLKETYINVLEQESKSPDLTMGYTQIPLAEQPSKTKEFELLNKEIELQDKLRVLEEKLIRENQFFEIISRFQDSGTRYKTLSTNYKIVYPIYSFLMLIAVFCLSKFIIYAKNYE
ncbi:MAG: hypothetical protein ACPH12_07025 [Flavobacteriaceae bacterium]